MMQNPLERTDTEWKSTLTPEQYAILRGCGTEPPFQNAYWDCKEDGLYHCAGCGAELFSSSEKYDSGTGWPSFMAPIVPSAVDEHEDNSWLQKRTEVRCRACSGHLGHVFPDGPAPKGERYCINSAALELRKGVQTTDE